MTQSVDAVATDLKRLLAEGRLSPHRVAIAAALGHAGAARAGVKPFSLSGSYRSRMHTVLVSLARNDVCAFAIECAERNAERFMPVASVCEAASEALRLMRSWQSNPTEVIDRKRLLAASSEIEAVVSSVDEPDESRAAEEDLGLSAAESVALAAQSLAAFESTTEMPITFATAAAKAGIEASADYIEECVWQRTNVLGKLLKT